MIGKTPVACNSASGTTDGTTTKVADWPTLPAATKAWAKQLATIDELQPSYGKALYTRSRTWAYIALADAIAEFGRAEYSKYSRAVFWVDGVSAVNTGRVVPYLCPTSTDLDPPWLLRWSLNCISAPLTMATAKRLGIKTTHTWLWTRSAWSWSLEFTVTPAEFFSSISFVAAWIHFRSFGAPRPTMPRGYEMWPAGDYGWSKRAGEISDAYHAKVNAQRAARRARLEASRG